MESVVLAPIDFVALVNQTLEFAYPVVAIEGELANFRISKNKWLYFDLQDEQARVRFFGTIYNLPGPLEDGLKLRVIGAPRLHPRFGFSVNVQSISPVGEGSIKKAADLLRSKLEAEGLFDPVRKRLLPAAPETIGLITAGNSAAYADFMKILNERWGGIEIWFTDVYVQGERAPLQIMNAIEHFNELPKLPDLLVVIRGGGSAEDLAAFSDERVVRAVAASRIPTLVGVGHEVDISLAELAADARASTPTNAAQLAVPNRHEVLASLGAAASDLARRLSHAFDNSLQEVGRSREYLTSQVFLHLKNQQNSLISERKLIKVFDPAAALKRGYAIISKANAHVSSVSRLKINDKIAVRLADGTIGASVEEIK
ncbi:MAG TPA: exodeoxyribonuclease VII large subunit [Candidatus Saccharimonadales bacterium]|nr:exodeoxyribonuclease VII large subunit [Candidatus Saccharimonadales bacterium]